MSDLLKKIKETKAKYSDVIVLCETEGDYEAYNEDALLLADIASVTVGDYGYGPIVTIDHGDVDKVLRKVIAKGKRIAFINQDDKTATNGSAEHTNQ